MKFRKLDNSGNIAVVGVAVATLVSIFLAVIIVYSIAGSIDVSGTDSDIRDNLSDLMGSGAGYCTNMTVASNATDDVLDQSATFFTIAPLVVVVMAAVVILAYVTRVGR